MSDTTENSTTTEEKAAPAKSKKKLLIIVVLALLLVGGGGGGFYFFRLRASAEPKAKGKNDKKKPGKDVEETEAVDEEESAKKESGKEAGETKTGKPSAKQLLEMSVPEDGEVKQVMELQPFIVNLADNEEPRYLRMTVSLGLAGEAGGGEAKPDPLFTTKVRNAMLSILTSKKSDEILTVEGKATLRKELLRAAKAAVAEPEVQAIYITDFIVQL